MERVERDAEIVRKYVEEHKSAGVIAREIGVVTRQTIWKVLKKNGVDTRNGYGTRVRLNCEFCNKEYEVTRSRWHKRGKRNFCSVKCYGDYSRTSNPFQWRQGQRDGRLVMYPVLEKVYNIIPSFVIHHKDGDDSNNMLRNLMAFPDQSNHLRYHRGSIACVLIDGESLSA